jgi:chemotaxis protein methyltransferase CheR
MTEGADPKESLTPSRSAASEARRDSEACRFIVSLVYERSRVQLNEGKQALIRARLGKRMRALHCATLADYCDQIRSTHDDNEITHVVDALTTNFTSFLREEDHFRFLVEKALPERLGRQRRRFQIWSAACASGEEPYSLAFYLDAAFPLAEGWDWQILATDISTRVLHHAREAIYAEGRLETLPAAWLRKYFQKGIGKNDGNFRVKSHIRERISFRQANLLALPEITDQFEAVFCRNVMIYFDRPTQQQLVEALGRHIVPSGYLLIGHSESLVGLPIPFRCLRPSYYQKR